jgi:hypothetical protein
MLRLIQLFVFLLLIVGPAAPVVAAPTPDKILQEDLPDDYVLSAPYPNPFNPSTSFSLTLAQNQQVAIEVYNLLGQRVERLHDGLLEAEQVYTFTFEADNLPTGIYLVRVVGEDFTATRQVTLLR